MTTVAVLTVSDRVSRGEAEDGSGDTLEALLRAALPVLYGDERLRAAWRARRDLLHLGRRYLGR